MNKGQPTKLEVRVETPEERRQIILPLSMLSKGTPMEQAVNLTLMLVKHGVSDETGDEFFPAHTIYKIVIRYD